MEKIAEADTCSLVKNFAEIYCDYFAFNPDLFSLDCSHCIGRTLESWNVIQLQRTIEGLVSLCLTLKKMPLVRYDKRSNMTYELATKLSVKNT